MSSESPHPSSVEINECYNFSRNPTNTPCGSLCLRQQSRTVQEMSARSYETFEPVTCRCLTALSIQNASFQAGRRALTQSNQYTPANETTKNDN